MIELFSLAITVAGAILAALPTFLARRRGASVPAKPERRVEFRAARAAPAGGPTTPPPPVGRTASTPSRKVLIGFAVVCLVFGVVALWRYWAQVVTLGDSLFLAGGLLLTMAGGMFVQVLTSNYTHQKPLLEVTSSQLLYPLLFSPIVFYPIWLIGNEQGAQAFSFYAAFLNGYFWQSVVAAAKRPEGG